MGVTSSEPWLGLNLCFSVLVPALFWAAFCVPCFSLDNTFKKMNT